MVLSSPLPLLSVGNGVDGGVDIAVVDDDGVAVGIVVCCVGLGVGCRLVIVDW